MHLIVVVVGTCIFKDYEINTENNPVGKSIQIFFSNFDPWNIVYAFSRPIYLIPPFDVITYIYIL